MDDDDRALIELERRAWKALATEGAAGPFYGEVLADEVLVLLPGGLVIDDRQKVIDSMGGAPWDSFALTGERVLRLGEDAAVVAYSAVAKRGDDSYCGLFNSTYLRTEGGWRMALHQQTPMEVGTEG